MKKQDVHEILSRNKERFKEFGVDSLYLFGSMTRGEAGPDSDIDLLVDFEPDAIVGLFDFVRLQMLLSKALGAPVDLVTRDALHPALKDRILLEAVHVA